MIKLAIIVVRAMSKNVAYFMIGMNAFGYGCIAWIFSLVYMLASWGCIGSPYSVCGENQATYTLERDWIFIVAALIISAIISATIIFGKSSPIPRRYMKTRLIIVNTVGLWPLLVVIAQFLIYHDPLPPCLYSINCPD